MLNNRFKFRCWDDIHREMIDLQEQDVNPYNISDIPQNNIMQCTDLKDKNGKLIFEGDIIRVQYIGAQIPLFSRQFSNLPKDEIFTIIYDHDWHKFRCENPNYKKTCEIHSLDLDAIQINTENKQYEIIGNIYENPELLEEEH